MKVLFCGLGSIGRRHARLLSEHFGAELFAVRSGQGQSRSPVAGVTTLPTIEAAAGQRFDAAFVTNPTHLHAATTVACIRAGVRRILLEKPIDQDLTALTRLEKAVRRSRTALYVGYPLRFHPAVREARPLLAGRKIFHVRVVCSSWLPDWRPDQDYRRSYSADARRGGGVLLDLSHELDLVEHLTGRPIEEITGHAGRSGALPIRAEDHADLLLRLRGGALANVHLDFMSRHRERRVQIDHAGGYLACDLVRHRLETQDEAGGPPVEASYSVGPDDLYVDQLKHFFAAPARALAADFAAKTAMTRKLLAFRRKVAA
jgi:predicted dehydrogenase